MLMMAGQKGNEMKFGNTYTDFYGNETELTVDELHWFFSVVSKFHKLPETDGLEITNRDHEKMSRRNRDALGLFYTSDSESPKADCFITIDNYFIHEKYESIFNGGFDIEPETLESVISHEIAHRYKFRHCKTHSRITKEILEKYNSL